MMLKQKRGTQIELATGQTAPYKVISHLLVVWALYLLLRQGSIPKVYFFFSVKQGLKYYMQEVAFLGGCVTRKFF